MARQDSSRPDVYQIITDRIIAMLEEGVAPWRKPWSSASFGAPRNLVSGKAYQGINHFLLGCRRYDSPYWLTFKQAQERGGHVKKGEKGSPCIFWKLYEKADENADGEAETRSIPVLRYYTVFNAEQCEDVNAPEIEVETWPENEKIARA